MQFDHEKLDVYQQEPRFISWTTALLARVKAVDTRTRFAEVADQLDRASLSALLNTAEANGKRQRQGRAKFFDDARGSATECAACLDALVAKGLCRSPDIQEGKEILLRLVAMLTRLVQRFDGASDDSCRLKEDSPSPSSSSSFSVSSSKYLNEIARAEGGLGEEQEGIEDENEDEDENENEDERSNKP